MGKTEEMKSVHVRFTSEDHEVVCAQANRDGAYSVAAWVRGCALRAAREGEAEATEPGYGAHR